jgi:release factor glutamine methyltransferase
MADEPWTLGRLLQWTTTFLKERGADTPRLDAEVLLAHAMACPRIALYTSFDTPATDEVRASFREFVKQRAAGKPVAYLVGKREFYSLSFRVTPDVLIPRPETEFLLIRLLDLVKQQGQSQQSQALQSSAQEGDTHEASSQPPGDQTAGVTRPPRILDVGTGSGVLAICAAREIKAARVTAVDISRPALEVARTNAVAHGVADRIEFVVSDLLAALPADAIFDFIVSNPPYIRTAEMSELAADVRDFEPQLALEAGPRGTEVIERLIPAAAEHLAPGGWLLIEVSPMIEPAVVELLRKDGRWLQLPTQKDLAGHPRVVQAQRKHAK